jgi:Ca2+-binding EF-hand superfamily protein
MNPTPKLTFAALGLAALGALATPALAQEHGRGRAAGERMFQQADANHDGRVTEAEAWDSLSARFARADSNKDGGVTWDEFRAYTQAEMTARRGDRPAPPAARMARMEQRGQGMFRALDADKDGKVTQAELRPFAEAMFRARDANGDNALTQDELRPRRARAERHAPAQAPTQAPAPTQAQ